MGESSRTVVVVYVNHGLVGRFSRGEYSTGIFPSAAVDPVAVKAVQVPGQRNNDLTLTLELDYNPRAAPFELVAVFNKNRQGKKIVAEAWQVRNISQQHLHEAVSGPKDKFNVTIPYDRAG